MILRAGTRLGPYEIVAPLGAGGMGEVYRARDTRLGRDVAVKVLPQHLSASPEDRARFRREAKAISSLNHPHICVLHDVGQEGDTDYLVMELVEGETLARRISRGPLPTADVLRIGAQIADALDRAHRAGITHRDLKPANVMLAKSGVKLMDFGLAREARAGGAGPDALTATDPGPTPKTDESITKKGTIVGTFQYMAPEQLEGRRADARSDLWALGCVLYEMATGKRAFEGSSPVSVISAIMRDEPRRMGELAPLTPPAFERVIRQCLAKDPDDRWQTAGDLRRELQWITEASAQGVATTPTAGRSRGPWLPWILLAIGAAATVITVVVVSRHATVHNAAVFQVTSPVAAGGTDLLVPSPDGKTFAFLAGDYSGASSIWLRDLRSLDARRLPGTEGARNFFWSPDSRSLAFFTAGKLNKIDTRGGPPVALCESQGRPDGSWGQRGMILLCSGSSGVSDSILMVSASGGTPRAVTWIDRKHEELRHGWPRFLPDGRHFLYLAFGQNTEEAALRVGSIDSRSTRALGRASSHVEYSCGHLLYLRRGTLLAQPFDYQHLRLIGTPFEIGEDIDNFGGGFARFAASSEGTLVYRSGVSWSRSRLTWINRRGDRIGSVGATGYIEAPAITRDGTQLAAMVTDSTTRTMDIWTWDLARNLESRLTFTNRYPSSPVWSPDGSRIAYGEDNQSMRIRTLGGAGGELSLNREGRPTSWSDDGRWITYTIFSEQASWDILALPLDNPTKPVAIATTPNMEVHAALSPDGKWVAYASSESGHLEVYVQSFPENEHRYRVSTQGGVQPLWRGDGRELFYLSPDRSMMSVLVEPGPTMRLSLPRKLFDAPIRYRVIYRNSYAVSRDGQRFLVVAAEENAGSLTTTVVLNWTALYPRR